MTPGEFKTMGEALGLSNRWLAQALSVNLRTVVGWQQGWRGDRPSYPPPDAVDLLHRIDTHFETVANNAAAMIAGAETSQCVLIRYLTSEDLEHYRPDDAWLGSRPHAALIWRTKKRIEEVAPGVSVRIVNMMPPLYEAWLAVHGLDDSEEQRASWAITQIVDV